MFVDALQYIRPSRKVFEQMREGQLALVHVTVGYHERYDEVQENLARWHEELATHADLICQARTVADIKAATAQGKTALMFGLQNPLALSADLRRVESLKMDGIQFCQVTYNQQSLLGAGYAEPVDSGVTAFGRECIAEMNRIGMVIDLSHAAPKTAQDAAELSRRPVAITHANPAGWHDVGRNVSDSLIDTICAGGGMLGFSLYPLHLKGGSDCRLQEFAAMAAGCVNRWGPHFGIGSDLCQDQPDSVVNWMRNGHWRKQPGPAATFPPQPVWFCDNRDFPGLAAGLTQAGLAPEGVAGVMGQNWIRFLTDSLEPA